MHPLRAIPTYWSTQALKLSQVFRTISPISRAIDTAGEADQGFGAADAVHDPRSTSS